MATKAANTERSWVITDNGGRRETYTEADLRKPEYRFPCADGHAYYQVKTIQRSGHDPIVILKKIARHKDNPDDWGEPERIVRVSELVRQVRAAKWWADVEAEHAARGRQLEINGRLYFLSNWKDKSGAMVRVLAVSDDFLSARIQVVEEVGDTGLGNYYRPAAVHDQVGVQWLYDRREDAAAGPAKRKGD